MTETAKNSGEVITDEQLERSVDAFDANVGKGFRCAMRAAIATLATPANSRAKNSGEVVACEKCSGEGKLYTSKYGGNDPDVWPIGTCDECEGSGEVELELDMERDLSSDELDLISQGFENYKTAIPVALIINDNQPGNTAIVEILCKPPTLVVGTELFAKPVLVRNNDTNSGQQVAEARDGGIDWPWVLRARADATYLGDTEGTVKLLRQVADYIKSLSTDTAAIATPANSRAEPVEWKAIKRACVVFCEKFDKGPFDELSVEDQQRLLTGMRPVIEAALPLPLENARHAKNLREVATILSTERIQGWANPLVCVLLDAEAALRETANSRAEAIGAEATRLLDFIRDEGPCAKEWEAISDCADRLRALLQQEGE